MLQIDCKLDTKETLRLILRQSDFIYDNNNLLLKTIIYYHITIVQIKINSTIKSMGIVQLFSFTNIIYKEGSMVSLYDLIQIWIC